MGLVGNPDGFEPSCGPGVSYTNGRIKLGERSLWMVLQYIRASDWKKASDYSLCFGRGSIRRMSRCNSAWLPRPVKAVQEFGGLFD